MQHLIAFLIVLGAAGFAAWRLSGLPTRLRLLDALARGEAGALSTWAATKARRLREAGGGGCAGCAAGSGAGKRPAGR